MDETGEPRPVSPDMTPLARPTPVRAGDDNFESSAHDLPPPTHDLPPPTHDLEGVRAVTNELVESTVLDKDTALRVMHIFHSMETLLRYECAKRDRRVCDVTAELERTRLHSELDRLARRHTLETLRTGTPVKAARRGAW